MFKKYDTGKPRILPLAPFMRQLGQVADVIRYGAKKYGDKNWQKCDEPERYLEAAQRHIMELGEGFWHDKESGKAHLAHAVCSLLMAWWIMERK